MIGRPTIKSIQNDKIKSLIRLRKRRERETTGLVLVEGIREIDRAAGGGAEIGEVFAAPDIVSGDGEASSLLRRLEDMRVPVTHVSRRVFDKIAYRGGTGGLVATARMRKLSLERLPQEENPLILVIDKVEKPGNLGAAFRSADGAGATGLILCDTGADPSNPNVIRASLGTVFTVPFAAADTNAAIRYLRDRGIAIITSTPEGGSPYTGIDMTPPCAIVLGSEDSGVSKRWMDASDALAVIPMRGVADSLNVSAAAAVLLYEAARQRSAGNQAP